MNDSWMYRVMDDWYVQDKKNRIFGHVYQTWEDPRGAEEVIRELSGMYGREIYCKSPLHHIGSPCVFCDYIQPDDTTPNKVLDSD